MRSTTEFDGIFWIDDYNPNEARRLLSEAGFPGGRGFPKIEVLYNTLDAHKSIAEVVQQHWKTNLGIDIEHGYQDVVGGYLERT